MADHAGPLLLRAGLITQNQLLDALSARRRHGGTLAEHLVRSGAVAEQPLAHFYRDRLLVPLVSRGQLAEARPAVIARIPAKMAEEFRVAPVAVDRDGSLIVAMLDPSDTHVADEVGFFADSFVLRGVATYSDMAWALAHHYQVALPEPRAPEAVLLTARKPSILPEEPVIALENPKSPAPRAVLADVTDKYEKAAVPRAEPSVVVDLGSPEHSHPVARALAELEAAQSEIEVSQALLRFVAARCRRAVFFRVKRGVLSGREGLGTGVVAERLRGARLALDRPSVFQSLVATRLPYRGPVSDAVSRDFLIQALGWAPSSALAVPITVQGHVAFVVYGDEQRAPLPDDQLSEVTRRAQLDFERFSDKALDSNNINGPTDR